MTLTALVVLLRPLGDLFLGRDLLQLLFLGAVLLSAWWGGMEAGLLTATLVVLAVAIAWLPALTRAVPVGDLAFLWPQGVLLSWLTASWHSRRPRGSRPEREPDLRTTAPQTAAGYPESLRVVPGERPPIEESPPLSETHFRHLAEAMPQIVWVAGPHGRLDYLNPRWRDYTGLNLEQTNNPERFAQVVHPEDWKPSLARWRQGLARGVAYQFELRLKQAADQSYRWFLGRAVPIRNGQGRIVQWFGTTTDIDEQKRTEETLKQADRTKDEFLAMLAHELRNPLAPIRNALHIMRGSELQDPALVEACAVVERQVQQLAGIVDDLLDLFRILHHKLPLRTETIDLAELVRHIAEDQRCSLEAHQLTLSLEVPAEPVWIQGDRIRLTQVLSNLLHNAEKFTNAGGQVCVRLVTEPEEQRAALSIQDTGIGIESAMLPNVFETFIQVDQSLDRSRGGLGLGLALVKGLVELHGGRVKASSPGLGHGAEFGFWLPLGSRPRPGASQRSYGPLAISSRRLRILIVEDNLDAARTLGRLLTRYGHDVTMAHTGPAGVEAARKRHPEVVLCDLGLPEMDGFEVARTLRQDPETADARLIAVSGYGQDEDRRRSEEAGFDLHLTKPVDPADLQRLLTILKVGP